MKMIKESNVEQLRDPFVLVEENTYYMYGSGWIGYKSNGDLTKWEKIENELVVIPEDFVENKWAPEVHKYNGAYYMFTTYRSSKTNRRGCTVLKSDSPEGPFKEISNGTITPAEWDCIDGTLYIDDENQPWMVFVHEWVSTEDNVGRMAAAKLSEDLTYFISEPFEMFRADEPEWAANGVTDGPYMYTTEDNELLMIWSNFDKEGYCTAVVRSDNGKLGGKWIHDEKLLFSKSISQIYDGGHAMIFTALDGVKYLSLHSPNQRIGERKEKPIFIPICEENGNLVLEK